MSEPPQNAASTYHDSHPVHTAAINEYEGGPLAFKREGDTIIVYPGAFRLTLSEWASLGIDNLRNKALKALEEGDDATLQAIVGETPIPAEIEKPKQARSYVDPY